MWTTALQIGELVETANDVTISYFFLIILINLAEGGGEIRSKREPAFIFFGVNLLLLLYFDVCLF